MCGYYIIKFEKLLLILKKVVMFFLFLLKKKPYPCKNCGVLNNTLGIINLHRQKYQYLKKL